MHCCRASYPEAERADLTWVSEVYVHAIPEYKHLGPDQRLLLVLVEAADTIPDRGNAILMKAQRHFPLLPPMLVATTDNGFKAYAHFQTHKFLALVQMLEISWTEIDLDAAPVDDSELPF